LSLAALLGLGTLAGLISLDGARKGLADPAAMSLGSFSASAGWIVVVGALDQTFVGAPKGFIGNIDTTISLRSATGQLLDERTLRLEWTARNQEQPPSHGESLQA
jgi:hypothetical protein